MATANPDPKPTVRATKASPEQVSERLNSAAKMETIVRATDLILTLDLSYPFKLRPDAEQRIVITPVSTIEPPLDINYLAPLGRANVNPAGSHKLKIGDQIVELPYGVVSLMGKGRAGKTTLARNLLAAGNGNRVQYISFDEPETPQVIFDGRANECGFELESELVMEIAHLLFDDAVDVIIVDSIRYLWNRKSGTTGKGGVDMGLLMKLTKLGNIAAFRGKTLILIANPLTDDEDNFKLFTEYLVSSAHGVMLLQVRGRVDITTRLNGNRDWQSIAYKVKPLGSRATNERAMQIRNIEGRETIGSLLKP